jgi:hypothetical protein
MRVTIGSWVAQHGKLGMCVLGMTGVFVSRLRGAGSCYCVRVSGSVNRMRIDV